MSKEKFDTEWTDEPVCPYCGSEQGDAWEMCSSDGELDCEVCGREFSYIRHITVNWETTPICKCNHAQEYHRYSIESGHSGACRDTDHKWNNKGDKVEYIKCGCTAFINKYKEELDEQERDK